MKQVKVISYRDPREVIIVDTTSHSTNWSRDLSPFFIAPVDLYDRYKSQNVENAWQFSKLYPEYANENGDPTEAYYKWAEKGWNNEYAYRYPMGKGKIPLCSIWDKQRLDYIEARKQIYVPLYVKAVVKTEAFTKLKELYESEDQITLIDFDGYDYLMRCLSLEDVLNNPKRKMGHAFVLAMLLEGLI